MNRPFNNYRTPISDPDFFVGRQKLLKDIGKQPFPVFIDLQQRQPESPDHFRYIIAKGLDNDIKEWRKNQNNEKALSFPQSNPKLANLARGVCNLERFISGNLTLSTPSLSPIKVTYVLKKKKEKEKQLDAEAFEQLPGDRLPDLRKLGFTGICFLLDIMVQKDWANRTFGYLRSIISQDFTSQLGLVFSGFKSLKSYQEQVGSPLSNIADIKWLEVLEPEGAKALIEHRQTEENIQLTHDGQQLLQESAGNHPYLLQQLLNALSNAQREHSREEIETIINRVMRQEHIINIFNSWWKKFSETEQQVYQVLSQEGKTSISALQEELFLSENAFMHKKHLLFMQYLIYPRSSALICGSRIHTSLLNILNTQLKSMGYLLSRQSHF